MAWTVDTVGDLKQAVAGFTDKCSITIDGKPLEIHYEFQDGEGSLTIKPYEGIMPRIKGHDPRYGGRCPYCGMAAEKFPKTT